MALSSIDINQEEYKAWIETVLQRQLRDLTVTRVLHLCVESAVPKGENYASQVYRVKVDLLIGSGRKFKRSFILKQPISMLNDYSVPEFPIFKSEIKVYNEILPEFEAIMNEFGDLNGKLWCKMIGYKPYNVILLEDLRTKNFLVPDRRNCLDLNHALLVLNGLARFHAISHVLYKRGVLNEEDLGKHYMESDNLMTTRLMEGAFKQLANVMEIYWPTEWLEVAQKLTTECKLVAEKIKKIFKYPKDVFLVLNHGDCWTCNLMFKYCSYEVTKPVAFKFLDFQISHFNSYILDVVHFLYMSVRPDIRRNNLDTLLLTYHKSLESTLEFYGITEGIPTLKDVYNEAERVEYLSMFFCLASLGVTTSDVQDSFYMEKLASDCDPMDAYNPESFKSERFRKMVEEDIRRWMKAGTI